MKQIKVIGAVGNNPRKDRDGFRVLHKGGQSYALQSHISVEPPLVVRKYERNTENRTYKPE